MSFSEAFIPARVSAENRNNYLLLIPEVGEVMAECTGKLLYNADHKSQLPKVGDWVLVQHFESEDKALIMERLQRRNVLSRNAAGEAIEEQVMAVHIDKVLIVQGLDDNFNINRLIRSVVLVRECGIVPMIVLNKADLTESAEKSAELVKQRLPDVMVMVISALQDHIDILKQQIGQGESFVLMGSSGVGKSTLVNRLLEAELADTGDARDKDAKGRHTTTRRELYVLPLGGILIDTPGMRELQLLSAKESLTETFDQLYRLGEQCRFKDCTHVMEAGCAVLEALDDGVVPEVVYENYLKLRNEDAYMEAKTDQKAYLQKKANDKQLHKEIRRGQKRKNR